VANHALRSARVLSPFRQLAKSALAALRLIGLQPAFWVNSALRLAYPAGALFPEVIAARTEALCHDNTRFAVRSATRRCRMVRMGNVIPTNDFRRAGAFRAIPLACL
jgi:hypothetical protein